MHKRYKRKVTLLRAAVGLGTVGLWELAVRLRWVDPFFFSDPWSIAQRLVHWFMSGDVYGHLIITMVESLLAFAAGALAGVLTGFVLARSELLAAVLDPYIRMLNSLPRVALAPIFILWFGLGIMSKVALGMTLVFFIVFFSTYQGVREVNTVLLDNVRMLGAGERALWRHVLIPSAMSWVLSSLHTSVGFALVGAVVGEYMGAARGLGYVIAQAEGTFDSTGVFAGMVVLGAVVLLVEAVLHRVEAHLLRWKPQALKTSVD